MKTEIQSKLLAKKLNGEKIHILWLFNLIDPKVVEAFYFCSVTTYLYYDF